jgi:hypothetical protein
MDKKTKQFKSVITKAFGKWIEEYIDKGWQCYLTTFMFNPLFGSPDGIVRQMSAEVERVYSTLLTRVVRNPRSPKVKGSLPILIGFPDLPVFKHNKGRLQDVVINDGLHYHAMVLLPPRSRLKESLERHFERFEDIYLGKIKTKKVAGRLRSKRVRSKLMTFDQEEPSANSPWTKTTFFVFRDVWAPATWLSSGRAAPAAKAPINVLRFMIISC